MYLAADRRKPKSLEQCARRQNSQDCTEAGCTWHEVNGVGFCGSSAVNIKTLGDTRALVRIIKQLHAAPVRQRDNSIDDGNDSDEEGNDSYGELQPIEHRIAAVVNATRSSATGRMILNGAADVATRSSATGKMIVARAASAASAAPGWAVNRLPRSLGWSPMHVAPRNQAATMEKLLQLTDQVEPWLDARISSLVNAGTFENWEAAAMGIGKVLLAEFNAQACSACNGPLDTAVTCSVTGGRLAHQQCGSRVIMADARSLMDVAARTVVAQSSQQNAAYIQRKDRIIESVLRPLFATRSTDGITVRSQDLGTAVLEVQAHLLRAEIVHSKLTQAYMVAALLFALNPTTVLSVLNTINTAVLAANDAIVPDNAGFMVSRAYYVLYAPVIAVGVSAANRAWKWARPGKA